MASIEESETNRPSLGVDSVSFRRFNDVVTGEGGCIIYDRTVEDAWIQSDEFYPLKSHV